jgi:hypothetical protein
VEEGTARHGRCIVSALSSLLSYGDVTRPYMKSSIVRCAGHHFRGLAEASNGGRLSAATERFRTPPPRDAVAEIGNPCPRLIVLDQDQLPLASNQAEVLRYFGGCFITRGHRAPCDDQYVFDIMRCFYLQGLRANWRTYCSVEHCPHTLERLHRAATDFRVRSISFHLDREIYRRDTDDDKTIDRISRPGARQRADAGI